MTFFLPLALLNGVFFIMRVNECPHVTVRSYFLSLQIIDRAVKDKIKLWGGVGGVFRVTSINMQAARLHAALRGSG